MPASDDEFDDGEQNEAFEGKSDREEDDEEDGDESGYKDVRNAAMHEASANAMRPVNEKSTRPTKQENQRLRELAIQIKKDRGDVTASMPGGKAPAIKRKPEMTRNERGDAMLLQKKSRPDCDEMYSEDEKALNEFLRLHPMCSLESANHKTLQLVSDLLPETAISTTDLEIVKRSHDEAYLRPPDTSINERPCCLGDRCLCVWLARWRHGNDTDLAFIGTEFLLPSQRQLFLKNGTLPSVPGKCLVCLRYYQTYIYRMARNNPSFQPSEKIGLQAFGNTLDETCGDQFPSHVSIVHDADGYRPEVMLFADETWVETAAARDTNMSAYLWRPVVKFCSTHYTYTKDANTGIPRMIQKNMASQSVTT